MDVFERKLTVLVRVALNSSCVVLLPPAKIIIIKQNHHHFLLQNHDFNIKLTPPENRRPDEVQRQLAECRLLQNPSF